MTALDLAEAYAEFVRAQAQLNEAKKKLDEIRAIYKADKDPIIGQIEVLVIEAWAKAGMGDESHPAYPHYVRRSAALARARRVSLGLEDHNKQEEQR